MDEATLGRPTLYTEELAAEICRRLAGGESLRRICEDDHMPGASTVVDWHIGRLALRHESVC